MRTFYNIPSHWIWTQHENISKINPKNDISNLNSSDKVSFLPMALVEEETGKYSLEEARELQQVKKGYTAFSNGDILFAKITPTMENGKVAIMKNLVNCIGYGSTEFHVSRLHETIEKMYIFYYFVQPFFRQTAKKFMTGSAGQLRVPTDYFKNVEIPLPPLLEQKAIVAKIEQLFSELDNGVANLKTAKAKLKIYRQAVLKKAFEERSFKYIRIGDVAKIISGEAFKKSEYSTKGVRLFQIANVSFNKILWGKVAYLPEKYLLNSKYKKLILEENDLVMALNRPMLNNQLKIGILRKKDTPSILYQRVGKFVTSNYINKKYLLYYLQSPDFTKWLSDELQGVNIPFINQSKLLAYDKFPNINIEEQNQIVQEIESRLSVCDKIEETIETSLVKSEALRQSILKKAFEGKLLSEQELENIKNHPEYENAEALLKRIKNERDK